MMKNNDIKNEDLEDKRIEKCYLRFNIILIVLAIILTFLAVFVTVADVIKGSNNNNISAYAVEEEHNISTSLPFDVVRTGTTSMYVFPTYEYGTDTWTQNVRSFGGLNFSMYVFYRDGNYYFSFDNTNISTQLFIYVGDRQSYYDALFSYSSSVLTLSSLFQYQSGTSMSGALYYCNLSNIEYNDFALIYVQSGRMTPIVFVEDIVSGEQDLCSKVVYNTTEFFSFGGVTFLYNLINYQYLKIYSTTLYNTISVPSINGFKNGSASVSFREFVFTSELMWEEGFNSGYDAGYSSGYDAGVSITAINPFQDKYMIDARLYNSAWSSHVDISDYVVGTGNIYSYGDFSINTNTVFTDALNSAYTSNPSYSNLELQFPAIYEHSPIACNLLNVFYVGYKYQDNWVYKNVDNVSMYIVLERVIGSSDPSDMVELSFTFIPNVELKIEFNNLNGIDYSTWFFSNLRIRMTLNSDILNSDKVFGINLPDGLYGTYTDGYKQGYREGMSVGNKGFLSGYNQGYADAVRQNQYTFFSLIGAVIDAPIQYFTSLFDYDILGTNIKGFLLALLTIGIALAVIRVSLGKK